MITFAVDHTKRKVYAFRFRNMTKKDIRFWLNEHYYKEVPASCIKKIYKLTKAPEDYYNNFVYGVDLPNDL